MEGEHPLFKAGEEIYVTELPGDMHPNKVARMLLRSDDFSEFYLGLELYSECLVEIIGNAKMYSEDIVIECSGRLNLLQQRLQRRAMG